MSVAIGRVSAGHLTNVATVERSRGTLTLKGRIGVDEPALAAAVATQIAGLDSAVDEPVIPVVWSASHAGLAHLNGYYRVSSTKVDVESGRLAATTGGRFPWELELDPVPGRGLPAVESILDTVLRVNSVSVTAAASDPWHAVPDSLSGVYSDGGSQTLQLTQAQNTATGSIRWGSDTSLVPPFRRVSTWRCRPEQWYQGAATIERLWGSMWLPVVGRDPHLTAGTDTWGITNGIVRVRIDPIDKTKFIFECWDGAWESATTVRFEIYSAPAYTPTVFGSAAALTVIRNDPAEVRVRITTIGVAVPGLLDLRLRRGSTIVECRWTLPGSTSGIGYPRRLDISPAPGAWTAIGSSGRFATAADANGNRLVQLWPITNDNTTATAWDTAIGFDLPADTQNTTSANTGYFAATGETVRIIGA